MEFKDSVNELRDKISKVFSNNPLVFHDQDYQRILKNDFAILRFLWHNLMDESKAYQMLLESIKWRKEFGINTLTDSYFPREFYLCGAVFPYCPDRNGFNTLFLMIKMIKKIPEMKMDYKKFLVHNINKIDLETYGKGWVLIVDGSGAGLSNCDLDLWIFLITTLCNHFPAVIQYIIMHSMSYALTGVWRLAKTFIPSERHQMIRFTKNKDIQQYISEECLPDFLGGCAKREYDRPPIESPGLQEFGIKTLGLPNDTVLKIVDSFEKILEK